MLDELADRFPYWLTAVLIVIGLYGMVGKRSLIKKIIGVNIFQVAIILFFIAGSIKRDATVPVLEEHGAGAVDASAFVNPLPHVLMLTAIVVAVSITGVALTFLIRIYQEFHTLDEREILDQVR